MEFFRLKKFPFSDSNVNKIDGRFIDVERYWMKSVKKENSLSRSLIDMTLIIMSSNAVRKRRIKSHLHNDIAFPNNFPNIQDPFMKVFSLIAICYCTNNKLMSACYTLCFLSYKDEFQLVVICFPKRDVVRILSLFEFVTTIEK
jgi:hypothetical protein